MKTKLLLTLAASALLLAACGGTPKPTPTPSSEETTSETTSVESEDSSKEEVTSEGTSEEATSEGTSEGTSEESTSEEATSEGTSEEATSEETTFEESSEESSESSSEEEHEPSAKAVLRNIGTGEEITSVTEGTGAYKLVVEFENLPDGADPATASYTFPKSTGIARVQEQAGFAANERLFVVEFAGKINETIKVDFNLGGDHLVFNTPLKLDIAKNDALYTKIGTPEDFVSKVLTATTGRFELTANLDLGGMDAPGAKSNVTFNGLLDGNGHTVSNFVAAPKDNGTEGGLWAHIGSGLIRNTHFVGTINQTAGWGSLLGKEVQELAIIENCLFEATSTVDTSALDWTWQRSGIVAGFLKGTVRDCVTFNVTGNAQMFDIAPYSGPTSHIQNVYTSSAENLSVPFDPNGGTQDWSVPGDVVGCTYSVDWATIDVDDVKLDSSIWTLAAGVAPKLAHDGESAVTFSPALEIAGIPNSLKVGEHAALTFSPKNFPAGEVAYSIENASKLSAAITDASIDVEALEEGNGSFDLVAKIADVEVARKTVSIVVLDAGATVEVLPVIAQGNSPTKIEGAGIWVYLDNTDLGITGANAESILADITIRATSENPAAAPYVDGGSNALAYDHHTFDDYGANTVRLFIFMNAGVPTDWDMTIEVAIKLTISGQEYAKTISFFNGVYQQA